MGLPLSSFAADAGGSAPSAVRDEARIPFKTTGESDSAGVALRVLGGFVIVALLALGAVYALKKYFPSFYVHSTGGTKRIQVLEIRRLTPRTTLFVVELDGTRLLFAQSGDRITTLHKTPTSDADGAETASNP
jgi:flagellar biogenesis protein FliO